jgi:hypothetical protein
VRYALALILALAVVAPAPAQAFCFKEIGGVFHKPKVVAPSVPVQIRPAGSQTKPDSFCKVVGRSVAITMIVQTIVIGAKVGLAVATGVLIL